VLPLSAKLLLNAASLSADTLARVLEQSADCVKLIDLDGRLLWMNGNGLCAMEIDDISSVRGSLWADLWPEESRAKIEAALPSALSGTPMRFDAFCPTAKGTPRWWNVTVSLVKDDSRQNVGFLSVSRDVTEAEAGRRALHIAAQELRHRLKNTYAMISSLLFGFARGVPEHETFASEMQGRLISLSAAQSLFASDDVPCKIALLIPALVTPFETPTCTVSITDLPATLVEPGQADAISLVLGELAVNSTKHGALANAGSIELSAVDRDGLLALTWDEQSSAPVAAHARTGGQGLKLIERIVQAHNGKLDIEWREFGLRVTLQFNVSAARPA
jgi:PAS domain S-box-containing protein